MTALGDRHNPRVTQALAERIQSQAVWLWSPPLILYSPVSIYEVFEIGIYFTFSLS
jgi:hypothetical protein